MSNYLKRFYPFQWVKLNSVALNKVTKVPGTLELSNPQKAVEAVQRILETVDSKTLSFTVHSKISNIPNAGHGVYLEGKPQKKGQILCFYPGTIYLPSDPVFFSSISNQYILKCIDGLFVDGKSTGLSGRVYKSIYMRENWPGAIQISDWSWMNREKGQLRNPLAIGQLVNNSTMTNEANVYYQEVDLPDHFPINLRQYIPNMYWHTSINPLSDHMRVVVLVALRDIEPNEELYSTYMDIVQN